MLPIKLYPRVVIVVETTIPNSEYESERRQVTLKSLREETTKELT